MKPEPSGGEPNGLFHHLIRFRSKGGGHVTELPGPIFKEARYVDEIKLANTVMEYPKPRKSTSPHTILHSRLSQILGEHNFNMLTRNRMLPRQTTCVICLPFAPIVAFSSRKSHQEAVRPPPACSEALPARPQLHRRSIHLDYGLFLPFPSPWDSYLTSLLQSSQPLIRFQ